MKKSTKLWATSIGLLAAANGCALLRDRYAGESLGAAMIATGMWLFMMSVIFCFAAMNASSEGK